MATTRKPARTRRPAAPKAARPAVDGHTATFVGADDSTTRVRLDDGQLFPLNVAVPVDVKTARQLLGLPSLRFQIDPPLPTNPGA